MTKGTFNVSRTLWDDPQFPDEPFTKREAWLWLISEAAWKARDYRFGSQIVALQRGQLVCSSRSLAAKWQWSEAKVRRYLKMLQECQNIDADTDAGVTKVTIRNYDVFQSSGERRDAGSDAPTTHLRCTDDAPTKKEIIKKINTHTAPAHTREARPLPDAELQEYQIVANRCLEAMGLRHNDHRWIGTTGIVAQWLANGWSADLDIVPTVKVVAQRRRDSGGSLPRSLNFFTNSIEEAHRARIKARGGQASPAAGGNIEALETVELKNGVKAPVKILLIHLRTYWSEVLRLGPRAPTYQGIPRYRAYDPPGHKDCVFPDDLIEQAKAEAAAELERKAAG